MHVPVPKGVRAPYLRRGVKCCISLAKQSYKDFACPQYGILELAGSTNIK